MISTARYIYERDPKQIFVLFFFGTKFTEREKRKWTSVSCGRHFLQIFFFLFSRFIFCTILSASCLRYRVNHPRKKMIGSASMIMMVLIGPCFSPPKKSQEMRDDAATPSTSLITLLLLDPPNTTYSLTLGKKKSISFFFFQRKICFPLTCSL